MGPGFLNAVQFIPRDTDSTTRAVMEKWCTDHPNEHVVREQKYSEPEPRVYVYRASVKTVIPVYHASSKTVIPVIPFDPTYVRKSDFNKCFKIKSEKAEASFIDRIMSTVSL
jgi:hypothetical protein